MLKHTTRDMAERFFSPDHGESIHREQWPEFMEFLAGRADLRGRPDLARQFRQAVNSPYPGEKIMTAMMRAACAEKDSGLEFVSEEVGPGIFVNLILVKQAHK